MKSTRNVIHESDRKLDFNYSHYFYLLNIKFIIYRNQDV